MLISKEIASEGTSQEDPRALPSASVRWQSLAWPATAGFLFGYIVLHPVSMLIFQWLDPRCAAAPNGEASTLWGPVAHSFHVSMLPMGLMFGVIGALIALFYGCHRLMLTAQRNRLADELTRNERLRDELARLELANRRTSQFMAHDFKSALGCVAGFAGQLLEQPRLREDPEVAEALVVCPTRLY